jgi:hypothetical protein
VNVFGAAVQLCTLPWLGFVPDEVATVPAAAAARLSERLLIPVGELAGYGSREQIRTDHLREIAAYLRWRMAGEMEWKAAGTRPRLARSCLALVCPGAARRRRAEWAVGNFARGWRSCPRAGKLRERGGAAGPGIPHGLPQGLRRAGPTGTPTRTPTRVGTSRGCVWRPRPVARRRSTSQSGDPGTVHAAMST